VTRRPPILPASLHAARHAPATRRGRRAFTLLEIIVAVAIMALLATAIVPRLSGLGKRRFDLAVTQSADLIMMFAQRDMAGTTPVGIDLEVTRNGERRLQLLVLTPPPGEPDATELTEWRRDAFVNPVTLPDAVDPGMIRLVVDGEEVDIASAPFTHVPGDRRPRIELLLGSIGGDRFGRITLPPYAIGPDIVIGSDVRGGGGFGGGREPIDLDAAGRSREDW
jgi:prepilin-type N-terminal cleavage/methylation domain-containing protein